MDLADGTLCLPDEVRICLAGQRPTYRSNISAFNTNDQYIVIPAGRSTEVRIGINPPKSKLWVRRDVAWVPSATNGPGMVKFLQLTNISDRDDLKLRDPFNVVNDRSHDTAVSGISICRIAAV